MYNQQITVYNDDSSSDGGRVRSLSPNGVSCHGIHLYTTVSLTQALQLPWEVEKLKITPDDFADRIQYYHKFKVPMKNDAKGKLEDIIFREGDVIWCVPLAKDGMQSANTRRQRVCPDPSW